MPHKVQKAQKQKLKTMKAIDPLNNTLMDLVHKGLEPLPFSQLWTMFFFTIPILACHERRGRGMNGWNVY